MAKLRSTIIYGDLNVIGKIDSPALEGIPTAPTASVDANSTQIATTAFVKAQSYLTISSGLNASKLTTGTVPLAALSNIGHTQLSQMLYDEVANGNVAHGWGDHSEQGYLTSASLTSYAPLASPSFTGTPLAPTASQSINSNQIATTAFVKNAVEAITTTTAYANTSRDLREEDAFKTLYMASSNDRILTIPLEMSEEIFPIGTEIHIIRTGVGRATIAAEPGVILNSLDDKKELAGQYAAATLKKSGAYTWILIGALK